MRIVFPLVLLAMLVSHSASAAIPTSELDALRQFFTVLGGEHWRESSGWSIAGSDPCTWFGVQCNGDHVVQIRLPSNHLLGDFGAINKFKDLTQLGQLELWNNPSTSSADRNLLTGRMPIGFGRLANLFYVDLRFNQISDTLDAFVSLTKLQYLGLEANRFSGSIPSGLGSLSDLTLLTLNGNELTGTIPPELGQLTRLEKLWLYNNSLDSVVPSELGNLTQLRELRLGGNTLHGTIPPTIGNLIQLERLELGLSQLSGSLPQELENLIHLKVLSLGTNRLSGGLYGVAWDRLGALEEVYLDTNLFQDLLPSALAELPHLSVLRLRGNGFFGDVPDSYVSFARKGVELDLRWNALATADSKAAILDALSQGQFSATQTRAPRNIQAFRSARIVVGGSPGPATNPVFISWTPIPFVEGGGGYEVRATFFHGGSAVIAPSTIVKGKEQGSAVLSLPALPASLPTRIDLVFVSVRTFSEPNAFNPGRVTSLEGGLSSPIINIEREGIAVFDHPRLAAREGDILKVSVERANGNFGELKTLVSAQPGTASEADFNQPTPPQLVWNSGDSSLKTVNLLITADRRHESTETLTLALDSPGGKNESTVEIGDQTIAGTASDPVIATNSLGMSFSAWTQPQMQLNSHARDVFGRFLDSSGRATGTIIAVSTDPILDEYDPEVVALDDGSFVVAWIQESADGSQKQFGLCRPSSTQVKCSRHISSSPTALATGFALASAGSSSIWLGWTTPEQYFARELALDGAPKGPSLLIANADAEHSFSEPQLVRLASDRLIAFWTNTRLSAGSRAAGGEIQSQSFSDLGDLLDVRRTYGTATAQFQRQPRAVASTRLTALLAWIETGKVGASGIPQVAWAEVPPIGGPLQPVQRTAAMGVAVVSLAVVQSQRQCQLIWLSAAALAQQIERRTLKECIGGIGEPLPTVVLDLRDGRRESLAATATKQGLLLVEQLVAARGVRWIRAGRASVF